MAAEPAHAGLPEGYRARLGEGRSQQQHAKIDLGNLEAERPKRVTPYIPR